MGLSSNIARRTLVLLGSRLAILAVVLLAAGWAVAGPLAVREHARETPLRVDYVAYDAAGYLVRTGDAARLYDTDTQRATETRRVPTTETSYFVYLHPPIVGAMFAPLSMLTPRQGYMVFAALLALAALTSGALIALTLRDMPVPVRAGAAICAAGSTATLSSILSGQITVLLLVDALVALVILRRGRPLTAGLVLGLLFSKPHIPFASLVLALALRQWRFFGGMAITGVAMLAASIAIAGPGALVAQGALLRQASSDPASLYIDVASEQNVRGLFALFHVYGGTGVVLVAAAVWLTAVTIAVFAVRRCPYTGADRIFYAAGIWPLLSLVASPHVQYYDLALLIFPAMFVLRRSRQAPAEARPLFYGLLVALVLFVETAGMLAGARVSVSSVALALMLGGFACWPRLELWLTSADPVWRFGTSATARAGRPLPVREQA